VKDSERIIKTLMQNLKELLSPDAMKKELLSWNARNNCRQDCYENQLMSRAVYLLTAPPEYIERLSPETRAEYANVVAAIRARFWTEELIWHDKSSQDLLS